MSRPPRYRLMLGSNVPADRLFVLRSIMAVGFVAGLVVGLLIGFALWGLLRLNYP